MPTKPEPVLVLRTCNADMSSAHDPKFVYPKAGPVEAKDWDPNPDRDCGGGLHGLLWGNGDWSLLSNGHDAVWMIVSVNPDDGLVTSASKCRFRKGEVIYCGDRVGATMRILCSPEAMARAQRDAAEWAKKNNTPAAASSGNGSTAASSGDYSTAASSGKAGIAAAIGSGTKAKAGEKGLLIVTYWDETAERYRALVGEVGIGGIKADTWYEARDGKLAEVA